MSMPPEANPYRRSEAFAEDVLDRARALPAHEKPARKEWPARWLMHALPVAVALLGVAFAVVPPLG